MTSTWPFGFDLSKLLIGFRRLLDLILNRNASGNTRKQRAGPFKVLAALTGFAVLLMRFSLIAVYS